MRLQKWVSEAWLTGSVNEEPSNVKLYAFLASDFVSYSQAHPQSTALTVLLVASVTVFMDLSKGVFNLKRMKMRLGNRSTNRSVVLLLLSG